MHPMFAPAMAAALVAISVTPASAQADNRPIAGPMAQSVPPEVRTGPLPPVLTLPQALEEAEARSPALVAARADVEAARGRLRQARFRYNPILNVEVENFAGTGRSEEHTSELQSLMRISYAVFCLKKKTHT